MSFIRSQDSSDFKLVKPMEEKTLFTVDNDGFCAKEYTLVSQYGTHIDAPIHFANNVRSLEELPLKDFALPLFVIHRVAMHDSKG